MAKVPAASGIPSAEMADRYGAIFATPRNISEDNALNNNKDALLCSGMNLEERHPPELGFAAGASGKMQATTTMSRAQMSQEVGADQVKLLQIAVTINWCHRYLCRRRALVPDQFRKQPRLTFLVYRRCLGEPVRLKV